MIIEGKIQDQRSIGSLGRNIFAVGMDLYLWRYPGQPSPKHIYPL